MESFSRHLHNARMKWVSMSVADRTKSIEAIAKMDESAIARLKVAGRRCVRSGKFTERFLEEYFAMVDIWLSELKIKESSLAPWQKGAMITYARDIAF